MPDVAFSQADSKRIRSPLWDNVKAVLILLTVMGRFIGISTNTQFVFVALWNVIYLFHMPMFAFVSGHFARNIYKNNQYSYKRIFSILFAYLFFEIIYTLTYTVFGQFHSGLIRLFTTTDAQWYLLALLLWYLFLPFFSRLKPAIALPATVIISLFSGFAASSYFLSWTRAINFLPYFLAGYYMSLYGGKILAFFEKKKIRILSVACALLVVICAGFYIRRFGGISFLTRDASYRDSSDILRRLANGLSAVLLGLGLFAACPRRVVFFTYIGARTMQIYVYHIIVVYILKFSGCMQWVNASIGGWACVLCSIGCTFLLSLGIFSYPFRWFDTVKLQCLYY